MNIITQPSRVAVVGCGYWGKNLVRNFAELDALTAVVEPNGQVAADLSRQFGVPAMTFDEALRDDGIAAIATASPAHLHRDIVVKSLEAGKHVFVEKPIALTREDGIAMRDASLRAGRVLMVGHLLQYHPAYVKLKQLVAEGAIGQLRYVYSNRLSMGKIRTEEDVVWSFAPHDISMVLGLSNEAPDDVSRHGARLVSEHVSDSAHLHLSFPSGLKAHIFTSWLSPHKEQRLVAIGETGSLVFDDVKPWNEKLVLTRHGLESGPVLVKGEVSPVDVEQAEPLKVECAHFLNAIRANKPPRTDAEEALAVLDVLMRADEAVGHAGNGKK